jgi:hypothetical protein
MRTSFPSLAKKGSVLFTKLGNAASNLAKTVPPDDISTFGPVVIVDHPTNRSKGLSVTSARRFSYSSDQMMHLSMQGKGTCELGSEPADPTCRLSSEHLGGEMHHTQNHVGDETTENAKKRREQQVDNEKRNDINNWISDHPHGTYRQV